VGFTRAAWRNIGAELAGCTSLGRAQNLDLAQRFVIKAYTDYQELIHDVEISGSDGYQAMRAALAAYEFGGKLSTSKD
jgi:hypothetical protein